MYLYVKCKKPTIFFIHEWKKTYADELIFSSWVKKYANQILVSQFQFRFPYFSVVFKNSWKKSQLLSFWLLYKIVDFYMKAIFWSKYIYRFYFYFWRIVFLFLIVHTQWAEWTLWKFKKWSVNFYANDWVVWQNFCVTFQSSSPQAS